MVAINVAQLLKSPVGSTRHFDFDEREPDLEQSAGVRGPIRGHAHLVRTQRGILVKAEYATVVELACSRCLETFLAPIEGSIEEEFLPRVDVTSGVPLAPAEDEFLIGEDHVLDLTEAIRQDILVRVPLQPLCMEACRGLCPECGAARNREACTCQPVTQESPFQALADLLEKDRTDNGEP